MEDAVFHQLVDGFASLERWILLNKRLRPKEALIESTDDLVPNTRIADLNKTANIVRIIIN
jgi:hypothetical protein